MKKQHLISALIGALLLGGALLYTKLSQPQLVYVLNGQLYADFDMKKQLEARMTNVQQQRKAIIDSLSLQTEMRIQAYRLNNKQDSAEAGAIRMMQQELYLKQRQFEEDNQRMSGQYDEQIWKQLNQYVQEYGKEKGYEFVFGANGDGGIMYAADAKNITADVKVYVNNRYKGGK